MANIETHLPKIKVVAQLLLLVISIQLSSCQESTEQFIAESKIDTLTIIDEDRENLNINEYFDRFEFIPLETTEESSLSFIDDVKIHNEDYYVLDRNQATIFVFDSVGQFIRKIKRTGEGPGMYRSIDGFEIDKERNQLVVYSDIPGKLSYLDLEGGLIEEFTIDEYQGHMAYSEGQVFFFDVSDDATHYFSAFDNGKIDVVKGTGRVPDIHKDYYREKVYPLFYNSSNEFYSVAPLDNRVYNVKDGQISLKYILDFKESNLPDNLYSKARFTPNNSIFLTCYENGYGAYVSNFMEFDKHIVFKYLKENIVVYNKETAGVEITNRFQDADSYLGFANYIPHNSEEDFLLVEYNPSYLSRIVRMLSAKTEMNQNQAEFLERMESLSPGRNPVLAKYYFK